MNKIKNKPQTLKTLNEISEYVDYSLMYSLNSDPQSTSDGMDHDPREVYSGHYVPVKPTPIKEPLYISHSKKLFEELNFDDSLANNEEFMKLFSGDTSTVPETMSNVGWACGYALSIYGTEYYNNCPFGTGNGYGDGRAISILEMQIDGKRWEMQLKGGGRTPYCRGADGRAVLRSSVREFLAQEHMYALGVPTSRSLSFYTSKIEKVRRPWFSQGSHSQDPDVMILEDVAISTRVAPSFIRVGQIDLFARRVRRNEHPKATEELEKIVLHLIDREYSEQIDKNLSKEEKIVLLASLFRDRLINIVVNWLRVGYCQGNFNSDNCAAGGFTLDYGPFGFMEMFDPSYQSWTGGGRHFSFFNQAEAARKNFNTFCNAIEPLLSSYPNELEKLNEIKSSFPQTMNTQMEKMWAKKLGMESFDEALFNRLMSLMLETGVDYTIFFRELSQIPENIDSLKKSFYGNIDDKKGLEEQWSSWLEDWKSSLDTSSKDELSKQMNLVNPKYVLREWILVGAYEKAQEGDYSLVRDLQEIMNNPYEKQSSKIEEKYYKLKPSEFFDVAGVSFVSCSS